MITDRLAPELEEKLRPVVRVGCYVGSDHAQILFNEIDMLRAENQKLKGMIDTLDQKIHWRHSKCKEEIARLTRIIEKLDSSNPRSSRVQKLRSNPDA